MKGFPDLPPIWWLGSIAVIYAAKFLWPAWHFPNPALNLISWLVFASGVGLIGWSAIWFFRKKTTIEPHRRPKTLIVEGPYRVSRNPIYLAFVLLTVASAFGQGSLVGLGMAVILWRVLDRRFADPEEALLLQVFGAEAEAYLARTRRWI